jgi:hypothetical protein
MDERDAAITAKRTALIGEWLRQPSADEQATSPVGWPGPRPSLRLVSVLIDHLRRPWHKKPGPGQILSPYRVRLGFRRLRAHLGTPARTAKSTRPGPGPRPRGSKTGQGQATDLP